MVHQLIKGTINGNHRGTRSKQNFLPKNLKNYLSGWCRRGGLLLLCSPALPCCCPPRTWPRSPLDGNESRLAHAGPPLACGRPGHLRSPGFLPASPCRPSRIPSEPVATSQRATLTKPARPQALPLSGPQLAELPGSWRAVLWMSGSESILSL